MNIILLLITLVVTPFTLRIIYLAYFKKPKLMSSEGKEIKVTKETRAALIEEYKKIKTKKSKFSTKKRKKITELVDHMVDIGMIHKSELK